MAKGPIGGYERMFCPKTDGENEQQKNEADVVKKKKKMEQRCFD